MGKTVFVVPRRGVILAGIPAAGGNVPLELAEEWIAAGLAHQPKPPKPVAPATKPEGK